MKDALRNLLWMLFVVSILFSIINAINHKEWYLRVLATIIIAGFLYIGEVLKKN